MNNEKTNHFFWVAQKRKLLNDLFEKPNNSLFFLIIMVLINYFMFFNYLI